MTPEQLERFRTYVERLSDKGLEEALRAVLIEMAVRGRILKRPPETPPEGGLKDCDPNREP